MLPVHFKITLNTVTFVDFIPPVDCESLTLVNPTGNSILARQYPGTDPNTEITVVDQYALTPPGSRHTVSPRFSAGMKVLSLKGTSGVQDVFGLCL